MSAPVITAPARRQASTGHWAFGAIAFVGLAFVITLIAFQIASPTPAQQAVDRSHYGAGYPLHGGLAGPSRVSVFDQHPGYGAGYPVHGGLAGPTPVVRVDGSRYGAGYPLHGGLAGPSQVGEDD